MRGRFEFNSEVVRVAWNDASRTYSVELADGRSGEFNVVVSAVGLFNTPNYPKWSENISFRGPAFHASMWEHEHDLRGSRVAVVGAGSTGAQIVTAIAPEVGHLFVFQRDPTWVLQKNDVWYSAQERRRRRNRYVYQRGRLRHAYAEQKRFVSGELFVAGSKKNLAESAAAQAYIERALGDVPDLKEAVTPTHPFFAKRNIKADGYLETLRRDNVTFVRSEVVDTSQDAVIDASGRSYEVDVIIMATGYQAADYLHGIDVIGRSGLSLHQYWDSVGGPEAFLGMTVPRFPNFYMLYGPNTNVGAIVFDLETQSRYLVRDLKRMRRSGAKALEVRESANRLYNSWLQSRLSGTIWAGTKNYHKSTTGKLVVPFPRASIQYWAMTRLLRTIAHKAV
jgi:cation diffusion facilitator CzcD-associated flavoprotein CzcO